VSSNHAVVSYDNGTFFITDRSTNGVFVGTPGNRLEFRTPYALNSGDTLFIEPYTVQVTVDASVSTDDLLNLFPSSAQKQPAPSIDNLQPDPFSEPYTPPRPSPAVPAIPRDWNDPIGAAPERAEPTPKPSAAVAGSDWLRSVFEGAGLENVIATPELARQFGQILRVVVEGVMEVLQARREVKREFRMDQTMFRAADNNPLKFSTSVEDALHNLLVKRVAGYLGPVDAFEDAFDDIRSHQVAMLAGLRVAFDAMLQQFDPERLQEEFDRQTKKAALVSLPAKLRYWDQYSLKFHDMVRDSEACYSKLFGDEFARAYEEQLSRLKGQSRPPKR
jgi:predicted component of type VI protein secretion system